MVPSFYIHFPSCWYSSCRESHCSTLWHVQSWWFFSNNCIITLFSFVRCWIFFLEGSYSSFYFTLIFKYTSRTSFRHFDRTHISTSLQTPSFRKLLALKALNFYIHSQCAVNDWWISMDCGCCCRAEVWLSPNGFNVYSFMLRRFDSLD